MGIKRLSQTSVIECDGTFKMLLSGYSQLYSFHANDEDVLVPCLLCLTKDRTSTTYIRLLNVIDTIGREFEVEVFGMKNEEVMRVMINSSLKGVNSPTEDKPTISYEKTQENIEKGEGCKYESVDGQKKSTKLKNRRQEVTVISDFEN